MKLCPQCEFIYEDNQKFCDMDGKVLVHDSTPMNIGQAVPTPTRLTISLAPRSQSKRFPFLFTGVVILATLASVFCLAHLYRFRNVAQSSVQSPAPEYLSKAGDTSQQTSVPDQASSTSVFTQLPENPANESLSSDTNVTAAGVVSSLSELNPSPSSGASAFRARVSYGPVSAGGPKGNGRGPVIMRLNNGAAIRADEAWERREGIWYRQAGMVTYLKRSRVRTIEPLAPPAPPPKSAAGNERRKSENAGAQNQLRLRQLEAVNPKRESRVRSFMKKTGRVLKKPFTF